MTELNDHLKLLFARLAVLYDRATALPVPATTRPRPSTPSCAHGHKLIDPRLVVTFPVQLPTPAPAVGATAVGQRLHQGAGRARGFGRQAAGRGGRPFSPGQCGKNARWSRRSSWRSSAAAVHECVPVGGAGRARGAGSTACTAPKRSAPAASRCPPCSRSLRRRGLRHLPRLWPRDRVDYGLVIPDEKKTRRMRDQAIQTPAWQECQDDLMRHAEVRGIPRDTPGSASRPSRRSGSLAARRTGTASGNQQWYGISVFDTWRRRPTDAHPRVCCPSTAATRPARCARRAPSRPTACSAHRSNRTATLVLDPAQRSRPRACLKPRPSSKPCPACACTT